MGTINFVLIGARNTGKTCYLAVLASHCPGMTTASDETTTYLKAQRSSLDAGELPQATASSLRELMFRYTNADHKVEFSIDDYDGSFVESLSQKHTEDDESRNALKARIQESEGIMFFMPYETQNNEEALSNFEDEINKIVSLAEEITDGKYSSIPIPACVCVTKWDRSPDYQSDDELDAAEKYIASNPYYKRAYAKINKLFEHVHIYPVSAFGISEDGQHPIKGKIKPYQLEEPIDYCLNKLFLRYDQKIAEYQKSDNKDKLFEYLCELYDDLKHYREGEYCRLYDTLEQKYFETISQEVKEKQQLKLSDAQAKIFQCIRKNKLEDAINQVVHHNKRVKKNNKIWLFAGMIVLVLVVSSAAVYFIQTRSEQQEFREINASLDNNSIPIVEIMSNVKDFHQKWETPMGLPIPSWFEQDRKKIINKSNKYIRNNMKGMVAEAQNSDIVKVELMRKMELLNDAMNTWFDTNLLKTLQGEIQPFLNSYQTIIELRSVSDQASPIDFKQFYSLKNKVSNMVIQWSEASEILNNIHDDIRNRVINIANNAVDMGDLDALEKSIASLSPLVNEGDNEAIHLLEKKVKPSLMLVRFNFAKKNAENAISSGDIHFLNKSVEELIAIINAGNPEAERLLKQEVEPALKHANKRQSLKGLLSSIGQLGDIAEITKIVKDHREMAAYTESERAEIKGLLQKKYVEFESKGFESFKNKKIATSDDLKGVRDKLKKLYDASKTSIYVTGLDEEVFAFRYIRPDEVDNKIEAWKDQLDKYDTALNKGISGYVTFKVRGRGDLLDFKCGWFDSNAEIELTITSNSSRRDELDFPNDDNEREDCVETVKPKITSLKWKKSIYLKVGSYAIKAVEEDRLTVDDTWQGSFTLLETDIFKYINNNKVELKTLNGKTTSLSPYTIVITKY